MKHNNDFFQQRQYMKSPDYEIYNYSDKPGLKVQPHAHDFYEIYLLLSNAIDIAGNNQLYHAKNGDIFLFSPNALHYPTNFDIPDGSQYHRIVFWISYSFWEQFISKEPGLNYMWDCAKEHGILHIRPDLNSSKLLYSLFLRLIDEKENTDLLNKTMIFSLMGEIFVHINRIIFHSDNFPNRTPITDLFNNILYYIHSHIAEDVSLETLSRHFFVTKGYISRIFHEYMDISVHQYVLSLRLENACNKMHSGISILQAAEESGFPDYSCFYRAFKKTFSVSPRQYMQNYICGHPGAKL